MKRLVPGLAEKEDQAGTGHSLHGIRYWGKCSAWIILSCLLLDLGHCSSWMSANSCTVLVTDPGSSRGGGSPGLTAWRKKESEGNRALSQVKVWLGMLLQEFLHVEWRQKSSFMQLKLYVKQDRKLPPKNLYGVEEWEGMNSTCEVLSYSSFR